MFSNVWKYANNGAITGDGRSQLSGVDRTRYLVRFDAELVLLECENYTVDDRPRAAIYLSQPMNWITQTGERAVTNADRERLRAFISLALPVIGRDVSFE